MAGLSNRTMPATPRRRREARRDGRVAQSGLLRTGGQLLVVVVAASWLLSRLVNQLSAMLKSGLQRPVPRQIEVETVTGLADELSGWLATAVLPLLVVAAVAGVVLVLLQTGFLWSPAAAAPKWERLSVIRGLARLFSCRSLVRLFTGVCQLMIIGGVAAWYVQAQWPQLLQGQGAGPAGVVKSLSGEGLQLAGLLAVGLLLLGGLDWLFQRWQFEQDLKMTPQEWREEQRLEQPDRRVVARRRRREHDLAAAPLQATAESVD